MAVFLTLNLVGNIAHNSTLTYYLALPLDPAAFLHRFWTIFTYMFTHESTGHVLFNLLLLFFSGQMFYTLFGEKKLVYVYVMSGLCGGALLLLLGLVFPGTFFGSYLLGASAAIMGIIMVMAIYTPNLPVNVFLLFEMPYKYFAMMVFVLSTVVDFASNTGGKISHVGGAAFGLIYGYALKNGRDFSDFSFLPRRKKQPLKVVHKSAYTSSGGRPKSDDEHYLDALLDKISKSGYDSLTKKEKEDLFKLSQKK
ncbi:MAG: rhomboid family intramembrane serine protease [Bacteroidia bacterium]